MPFKVLYGVTEKSFPIISLAFKKLDHTYAPAMTQRSEGKPQGRGGFTFAVTGINDNSSS
jgi:hypothetical protein